MVVCLITFKDELITYVVARTCSGTRVGAILGLQFGIELLVYHRQFDFVFHIYKICCAITAQASASASAW